MKLLISCGFLFALTIVAISAESVEKRDTEKRGRSAWPRPLSIHVAGGQRRRQQGKRWTPFIFSKSGKRGSLEYDTVGDIEDVVKEVLAYMELKENGMLDECLADKSYIEDANAVEDQ
ncbi:uncharacterized protein [Ptychodera flava]|uniref:uncharacterized protein isoform X2 n=1 Tax=Ptychodera flava TaxID=63121 RepID=UPI003969CAF3